MNRIAEPFSGADEVRISVELRSGASHWTVSHAALSEAMNEPYRATLHLTSSEFGLDPTELLGERLTIRLERGDLERLVHGVVDEVIATGDRSGRAMSTGCIVRVVPALALLEHRRDTRIFQDQSVPEILKTVLAALSDYDGEFTVDTSKSHPKSEYRTQYDETDLQFVLRLIGDSGLSLHFEQGDSVEKVIVGDDVHVYRPLESTDGSSLPYVLTGAGFECVRSFSRSDRIQATKLALQHFDWTRPHVAIQGESPSPGSNVPAGAKVGPAREIYEHDTEPLTLHSYDARSLDYRDDDHAEQLRTRRESQAQRALTFDGDSNAIGLRPGSTFELLEHPTASFRETYLVVAVTHDAHVGDAAHDTKSFGRTHEATYTNHFVAVPSGLVFRASKRAKRRIAGIATATVVGPSGEEIHTDEHGRVKLQFHWDRVGRRDEHSSCYVRVMQAWAGAGWGS